MPIRRLAHGYYSLLPTLLTFFGWLFALFQDGCDYVKVQGPIVAKIATQPNAPYLEAGRNAFREPQYNADSDSWSSEFVGGCLVYPEDEVTIDVYWNVSKGFDFISIVLGGTGALFLTFTWCCVFSRGTWRLAGVQVFMAAVFQSASFLWLETELCQTNTCELFWGSYADIASICCWILAAVFIFCHYPVPFDLSAQLLEEQQQQSPQRSNSSSPASGSRDGIIAVASTNTTDNFADFGDDNELGSPKEDEEPDWLSTPDGQISSSTGQESGEGSREESGPTPARIV